MASNLNDLKKAIVILPLSRNMQDGERIYFGGGPGTTLNTAILTELQSRGATSDNVNTAWAQFFVLNPSPFGGNLQDQQKEFWKGGGFPP